MRMWHLDPRFFCRPHLLGAHKEIHTGEWYIQHEKYNTLHGHEAKKQFDVTLLIHDHDEIAAELLRRGYKHHSPIKQDTHEKIERYTEQFGVFPVDVKMNLEDLLGRCPECRANYEKLYGVI